MIMWEAIFLRNNVGDKVARLRISFESLKKNKKIFNIQES